jgi:glycosyltransferase involved in cell wall biosynthesis
LDIGALPVKTIDSILSETLESFKVYEMSQSTTEKLDWGLVIATYKREAILPRCLRLAAQQTVPPKEIIVVDASPYWEKTRHQIMQELAAKYPTIDWKYVQAKRASSAAQRNQGIDLATADILFLIDDDSLMYPDCVEEVMHIYTHDTTHKIVSIMCSPVSLPPDIPFQTEEKRFSILSKIKIIRSKLRNFVVRQIKRLTNVKDDGFIPYSFSTPKQTIPDELKNMAVCPVHWMPAAYMAFRREVIEQVRFEEILVRYAKFEDIEACYRASHVGMMLHALKARIWHADVSKRMVSRFTYTAIWGLNLAVLHRLYSSDLGRSKKLIAKLLWPLLIDRAIFRDVLTLDWSLPSIRGFLFAFRYHKKIFSMTPEELRAWYPQFQQTLFDQNR